MKARLNDNNEWIVYGSLPKSWGNKHPYNAVEEGFKDASRPTLTATQKLGSIYYDEANDLVTYNVIEKTVDEIRAEDLVAAQVIPNLNFKLQLSIEGITEADILAVIDTLPEPDKTTATISYYEAGTFARANPFIALIGQAFSKTDDELDTIFIKANKILL